MTSHRIPKCVDCQKPLGSTVLACHDCRGSDLSDLYGELSRVEGTTVRDDPTYRGGERNVAFGELVR